MWHRWLLWWLSCDCYNCLKLVYTKAICPHVMQSGFFYFRQNSLSQHIFYSELCRIIAVTSKTTSLKAYQSEASIVKFLMKEHWITWILDLQRCSQWLQIIIRNFLTAYRAPLCKMQYRKRLSIFNYAK